MASKGKKVLNDAATIAFGIEMQLLGFCEQKLGMRKLAEALIKIGRASTPLLQVNEKQAHPCGNIVMYGLIQLRNEMQKYLSNRFPSNLELGGVVTIDGVKLEWNRKKYGDFMLQYLKLSRRQISQGRCLSWEMCTRRFFTTAHEGCERPS